MKDVAMAFVAGAVTIGVVTALFLPGRTTASSARAIGAASSNLLGTAITGKK